MSSQVSYVISIVHFCVGPCKFQNAFVVQESIQHFCYKGILKPGYEVL